MESKLSLSLYNLKRGGSSLIDSLPSSSEGKTTKSSKTGVWDETFTEEIDRDDSLTIKIWDEKKIDKYDGAPQKYVAKVWESPSPFKKTNHHDIS